MKPISSLTLALLTAMALALTIGHYPLSLADIAAYFGAAAGFIALPPGRYDLLHNLIVEIRLPRILAAALTGASLASSGTAFQAVFRNPLVSPGILGALGGAGFGAALGVLVSGNWFAIQGLAFVMGLAAVGCGILIANLSGQASPVTLVLGGMISGAFFTALLSIVKYTADPYNQLPAIVYWLMGSLGAASLKQAAWLAPPALAGIALLTVLGRALDAMTMGDDEARSLGVSAVAVRYSVIGAATLISALSVSLAGIIGWVGLVVPHVARMAVGPANGRLLPVCALTGALFLVCADCVARAAAPAEIPVGIVTELLGIPAFIAVLRRARKAWV